MSFCSFLEKQKCQQESKYTSKTKDPKTKQSLEVATQCIVLQSALRSLHVALNMIFSCASCMVFNLRVNLLATHPEMNVGDRLAFS